MNFLLCVLLYPNFAFSRYIVPVHLSLHHKFVFVVIINLMGNCCFTRREASPSRGTCGIHNEGELWFLEKKKVRTSNHSVMRVKIVISTRELNQILSCNKEGKKASFGKMIKMRNGESSNIKIGETWKPHLATIDEVEEHQWRLFSMLLLDLFSWTGSLVVQFNGILHIISTNFHWLTCRILPLFYVASNTMHATKWKLESKMH